MMALALPEQRLDTIHEDEVFPRPAAADPSRYLCRLLVAYLDPILASVLLNIGATLIEVQAVYLWSVVPLTVAACLCLGMSEDEIGRDLRCACPALHGRTVTLAKRSKGRIPTGGRRPLRAAISSRRIKALISQSSFGPQPGGPRQREGSKRAEAGADGAWPRSCLLKVGQCA